MTVDCFDIPVVLFIFKRLKAVEIIKRIAKVRPSKLYILADQGRDEKEKEAASVCRKAVENAIDWDCEIIKNYAEENRGVYENIGEGAKWVLRREKWAIFLEDDNLPEVSFFAFCKEMLVRYEEDERILWVCGTNYLGKYQSPNNVDYVFTRHMLPCGWASWSDKFEKYYNGNLSLVEDETVMKSIGKAYCNKKVYKQYKNSWMQEYRKISNGKRPSSWDYQMDFSIKAYNLYGICACNNQIKNIGVDEDSIHGGDTLTKTMTKRFCGMESYPITFPLIHPKKVELDKNFEKKIGKIILYPFGLRCRIKIVNCIKRIFKIPQEKSLKQILRKGK